MSCQICFDTFPEMYKVTCGSTVDHLICFDCEKQWREKMPIREGDRKMTCPTCRQQETSRDAESLQREVKALYATRQASTSVDDILRSLVRLSPSSRSFLANYLLRTVPSTTVAAGAAAPNPVLSYTAASRSTRPLPRVFCESGRDCRSVSRLHSRTKTHLKCRQCNVVACCATCRHCTGCQPLGTLPQPLVTSA